MLSNIIAHGMKETEPRSLRWEMKNPSHLWLGFFIGPVWVGDYLVTAFFSREPAEMRTP